MSADAEQRVKLLKDTHAYASELLRLAKDRMAHSDREPVEFKPEDFVCLVTKGLRIHQQSNKKLRDRQLGPFRFPGRLETELMPLICHERSVYTTFFTLMCSERQVRQALCNKDL